MPYFRGALRALIFEIVSLQFSLSIYNNQLQRWLLGWVAGFVFKGTPLFNGGFRVVKSAFGALKKVLDLLGIGAAIRFSRDAHGSFRVVKSAFGALKKS